MGSGSMYPFLMTLCLHVFPFCSYTYGFIELKAREASESEVFFTSAIVRFEMCPPNGLLNVTCSQEFAAVKAKFGPPSTEELVGSYKAVKPKDACDNILSGESQDLLTAVPVFALISKGNCSFDKKVANVEEAGFHAAIIYALKDDTNLIEMKSSTPAVPVSIPAFYVSHNTGVVLMYTAVVSNSTKSTLLSISIQEPSASKGAPHLQGTTTDDGRNGRSGDEMGDNDVESDSNFGERYFHICIYIWACVVVSSLIALSIKWGCCSRSLTRWEVKKIPLKRFLRADGFEYQDKCPICHEEFHEGYLVRQLPCNHCYHSFCVDRWLVKMSNRCPLCKQRVSVSLLCSWNKQPDRDNLTQSAAEAEAEASAGELPPLPPIQSLTPNSLYGETIMSGPSKFIIMRPGRPTRIIEVPKKEDGKTKGPGSRSSKFDSKIVSLPQEEPFSQSGQESSFAGDGAQKQLPVSSNATVQLSQTHAPGSAQSLGEHIHLECIDRDFDSSVTYSSRKDLHDQASTEEEKSTAVALVNNFQDDPQCECDNIHRLWLNKPEDVDSPLLNSGSNENNISCAKCTKEFASSNGADDQANDHSSAALLLSPSSFQDVDASSNL